MPQRLIAVDICNTLADINTEIAKVFGANPNPSNYFHPCVTTEFFKYNTWIFEKAQPFKSAANTLNQLVKEFSLVYVTRRPVQAANITLGWLKQHKFPEREVIHTRDKAEIAKLLNVSAAIEDAPFEIEGYSDIGIPVYVKRQSYNLCYQNIFDWTDKNILRRVS